MSAASSTAEPFVCGKCVALSSERNAPPATGHEDCDRCGDPTRTFVGQVIDGRPLTVTRLAFETIERDGAPVLGKPGVRLFEGREFYSARWL